MGNGSLGYDGLRCLQVGSLLALVNVTGQVVVVLVFNQPLVIHRQLGGGELVILVHISCNAKLQSCVHELR